MEFSSSQRQLLGRILRDLDQVSKEPLPEPITHLMSELSRVLADADKCPGCGSRLTLVCPVCGPHEVPL